MNDREDAGSTPNSQATKAQPSTAEIEGEILLDEPLVPNRAAENQMSADEHAVQLSDEEIAGARLLVVRKGIGRVAGEKGLAIELDACFDRPLGAYLVWAQIQILLTSPTGSQIASIAPKEMRDANPVKITLKNTASLELKVEKVSAKVEQDKTTEFNCYYCRIEASGDGTARAVWTFYDNPETREGVGHYNRLVLTVAGEGPFKARLTTACRIARPGMTGLVDKVRDLVFGPKAESGTAREIIFEAPPVAQKRDLLSWIRGT